MPKGGSVRPAIKDEQLIAELLTGCNLPEASRRTGQSLATVKRRNSDPGFQRKLMEHQATMVERVKRSIEHKTIRAAEVFEEIIEDKHGEASRDGCTQRIMAARALMSAFVQLVPKPQADPFDGASTPAVHCILVGVDADVLK